MLEAVALTVVAALIIGGFTYAYKRKQRIKAEDGPIVLDVRQPRGPRAWQLLPYTNWTTEE
jgi:hypothetical protein